MNMFFKIFQSSPIAITLTNLSTGLYVDMNPAAERLLGYSRAELLGADWGSTLGPATRDRLLQQLAAHGRVEKLACRLTARDGAVHERLLSIELIEHEGATLAITHILAMTARRRARYKATCFAASRRAEQQLRQSEARFATIFEHSPIALSIARMSDGVITDANPAFVALAGVPRDAILGRTALALGLWSRQEDRLHLYNQLRTYGRIRNFEIAARTATGEQHYALLSGEVVQIHNEMHMLIQFINISALKAAQQELRELNRTLEERVAQRTAEVQDLYDYAPTGYYSLDADGHVTSINQTLLSWLGYDRAELIGRLFSDFIAPAYRESFVADFAAFKRRGALRDSDSQLLRKDGSSFPVLFNASAIYAADGAYVSSRATVFNNTRRRQAEAALRESEAQNRLLFEESPEAMALFDNGARIVRANRAFARLAGRPIERLTGQTVASLGLLTPAQVAQLKDQVRPLLDHAPGFATVTVTFSTPDGEERVVEARAFALTIHGQHHYLAAFHDITTERRTEETLREANAELARVARAKDEFLATMSHELRTPINAILGFSESLQEGIYGPLSARQIGAMAHIFSGGRHLLSLVNDILDLAKVEAGRIEIQREWVSVYEICQISLMFVKEQALKKRLQLDLQTDDQQLMLKADPTRLKQMLVNLLLNAVKFTPDGGAVSLRVSLNRAAEELRFAVSDTGIGIKPADIGRLFQPFSQLASTLSREYEGTGLGLALVRKLAMLHSGSVTVESEVGKGSCFTIILPYQPMTEASASASHPQSAPSAGAVAATPRVCILLAEDNETNIDVLSDFLSARGYDVIVARDGHEALAQAVAAEPRLILMDIQMPRMDGLEAILRLRALPAHAATPIIALTALAMPGDEERCLAAGATAYMTKPVSLRDLAQRIQQLLAELDRTSA